MLFTAMKFFSFNALNAIPLKRVSLNNQGCKVRPEILHINSNEPSFYCYSILLNKCSGSCNNINDPYANLCIPDLAKDINVKVFNLMSKINETRHISQDETCKCKYRLVASFCNNKHNSFLKGWDPGFS